MWKSMDVIGGLVSSKALRLWVLYLALLQQFGRLKTQWHTRHITKSYEQMRDLRRRTSGAQFFDRRLNLLRERGSAQLVAICFMVQWIQVLTRVGQKVT